MMNAVTRAEAEAILQERDIALQDALTVSDWWQDKPTCAELDCGCSWYVELASDGIDEWKEGVFTSCPLHAEAERAARRAA
jgi:hypothetical protein